MHDMKTVRIKVYNSLIFDESNKREIYFDESIIFLNFQKVSSRIFCVIYFNSKNNLNMFANISVNDNVLWLNMHSKVSVKYMP